MLKVKVRGNSCVLVLIQQLTWRIQVSSDYQSLDDFAEEKEKIDMLYFIYFWLKDNVLFYTEFSCKAYWSNVYHSNTWTAQKGRKKEKKSQFMNEWEIFKSASWTC